jgi:hypothetical protein
MHKSASDTEEALPSPRREQPKVSLFDKNVMLLSAVARSRDSTPSFRPSAAGLRATRAATVSTLPTMAGPTQNSLDSRGRKATKRSEQEESHSYLPSSSSSTVDEIQPMEEDCAPSSSTTTLTTSSGVVEKGSQFGTGPDIHINGNDSLGNDCDMGRDQQQEEEEEEGECCCSSSSLGEPGQHSPPPRDCVSPAVCRKLLSLSEDMNLLVRNITKEAKALVQAEM